MLSLAALMIALVAIYVLMFRGYFGKRLGKKPSRNPDGPMWGAALVGGFAAGSIVESFPSSAELVLALAAVVGASCGMSGRSGPLSWPAGILGAAAALATAVQIWTSAPGRGVWVGYVAITVCMVALYATGEFLRLTTLPVSAIVRSRGGAPLGMRALGYFAALDLASFLLAPGGAGVLQWAQSGPAAAVVWLTVILAPVILGALDPAFLGMFCAGVSLALLYLSFVGLGDSGFVATMTYLATSMIGYWLVRWIVRGFTGRGLLSD